MLGRRAVTLTRDVRSRIAAARRLRSPAPVVVFTAPKSGTTTGEAASRRAGVPAIKAHFLGPSHDRSGARRRERGPAVPPHHHMEERLHRHLAAGGRRLRFVSLVRDPVARAVSMAFQSPELRAEPCADVEAMAAGLAARLERRAQRADGLHWLDRNLEPALGLDLHAEGFEAERGATRRAAPRGDLPLPKVEALDGHAESLSALVGRPLSIPRGNVRAEGARAALHAAGRGRPRLPGATLNRLHASPWMRLLYTEGEVARFRARWAA